MHYRIAIGSCSHPSLPQPLWPIIESRLPLAFVWGGDAIYADKNSGLDWAAVWVNVWEIDVFPEWPLKLFPEIKLPHWIAARISKSSLSSSEARLHFQSKVSLKLPIKWPPPSIHLDATPSVIWNWYEKQWKIESYRNFVTGRSVNLSKSAFDDLWSEIHTMDDTQNITTTKQVNLRPLIFGAIDDHDYGSNNGDSTFLYKMESNRAFVEFLYLGVPENGETQNPKQPLFSVGNDGNYCRKEREENKPNIEKYDRLRAKLFFQEETDCTCCCWDFSFAGGSDDKNNTNCTLSTYDTDICCLDCSSSCSLLSSEILSPSPTELLPPPSKRKDVVKNSSSDTSVSSDSRLGEAVETMTNDTDQEENTTPEKHNTDTNFDERKFFSKDSHSLPGENFASNKRHYNTFPFFSEVSNLTYFPGSASLGMSNNENKAEENSQNKARKKHGQQWNQRSKKNDPIRQRALKGYGVYGVHLFDFSRASGIDLDRLRHFGKNDSNLDANNAKNVNSDGKNGDHDSFSSDNFDPLSNILWGGGYWVPEEEAMIDPDVVSEMSIKNHRTCNGCGACSSPRNISCSGEAEHATNIMACKWNADYKRPSTNTTHTNCNKYIPNRIVNYSTTRSVAIFILDVRTNKTPWPKKQPSRSGNLSRDSASYDTTTAVNITKNYSQTSLSEADPQFEDFLGQRQWKWLASALQNSHAALHIIVSGLQIHPERMPNDGNVIEEWSKFPEAQQKLYNLLLNGGIENNHEGGNCANHDAGSDICYDDNMNVEKGIRYEASQGENRKKHSTLLVTGDVHMSQIMRKDCIKWGDILEHNVQNQADGHRQTSQEVNVSDVEATSANIAQPPNRHAFQPYQKKSLIEVTTSGMTHSWGTSFSSQPKYHSWPLWPYSYFVSWTFMTAMHWVYPWRELVIKREEDMMRGECDRNNRNMVEMVRSLDEIVSPIRGNDKCNKDDAQFQQSEERRGGKIGKQFYLGLNFAEFEFQFWGDETDDHTIRSFDNTTKDEGGAVTVRIFGSQRKGPPKLEMRWTLDELSGKVNMTGMTAQFPQDFLVMKQRQEQQQFHRDPYKIFLSSQHQRHTNSQSEQEKWICVPYRGIPPPIYDHIANTVIFTLFCFLFFLPYFGLVAIILVCRRWLVRWAKYFLKLFMRK